MATRCLAALLALPLLACGSDSLPSTSSGCPSVTCDGGSLSDGGEPTGTTITTTLGTTLGTSGVDSTATSSPDSATITDGSSETTGPFVEPSSARHTPRPLGETTSPQGYWEYLPPDYEQSSDHPLMVYLHGIGANGNGTTQLDRVLINGPAKLIDDDQWPYERPFVVLSPQHAGSGCTTVAEIQSFLAYAIDAYAIDPDRVHLTGISCGAIGAWDYLGNYFVDQITSAVLIAGDGRGALAYAGCALGQVPIWAFHGEDDEVVEPQGTIEPIEALLACEPTPDVQMTIYPGVRHESWHRVYDLSAGDDIYSWMLAH
ncbi:carboxylesterase family protein [Paraliomyxa miuraensis]|uniref:carboxylesterase family protein n=1 Tax=Paraliomyxa miuraensis TaxID=376150 RepID=UPI00224F202C|nr:hypothetical protein [Paraliomyxa miuraensis]MCX4246098.1 hypothetical protein [Paraliomyxa miuraensis]